MRQDTTKAIRRPLRFWGFGYADERLTGEVNALMESTIRTFLPEAAVELAPPTVDEFDLPESKVTIPASLEPLLSNLPHHCLVHTNGKSHADIARMFLPEVENAPDRVAFPRSEQDNLKLFAHCKVRGLAATPFGEATGVCSGTEADAGEGYRGLTRLDMENFNRILEVDESSRPAKIQAGILGPNMEAGLKPRGLTLRHCPRSFPFAVMVRPTPCA